MFNALTCLSAEHDPRLVALAGLVCLSACFVALDLLRLASASAGSRRLAWIATAAVAGGCGVWATHFIAILAYKLGVPVTYDRRLTALSLLVAIAAMTCGFALSLTGPDRWRVLSAGTVIGLGVGAMHFLGMAALVLPGRIEWSAALVRASLVCGASFASASIWAARRGDRRRDAIAGAILLALAIIGLHFTAMAAAHIVPDPARVVDAFGYSSDTIALGVAGATAAILALGLMGGLMDRRLSGQARAFDAEIGEIKALAAVEYERQLLRLAAAMDHMPLGFCMFDAEGRVVVCNANYERIYGLAPGSVVAGASELEIAELRRAAGSLASGAAAAGATDDGERVEIGGETFEETPDGRIIAMSRRALPDGGALSTLQDVTERLALNRELRVARVSLDQARRRAEEAAREAESALRRLRDALDAIPEGLALFDAEDRYVLWNARYAEIYAAAADRIRTGNSFEDVVRALAARGVYRDAAGAEDSWLRDRIARHRQGESSALQPMSDGRWIQISERRTSEGGVVAVHVDVSDVKRREASFQLLLQKNPIPMWVYDTRTLRYLTVNDAATEQYKYSRDEFHAMSIVDLFPEEDRLKLVELIKNSDGLSHRGMTWRHIKADGEQIEVAVYSRPMRYKGHDARVVAVFDISERKKIENRIVYLAHHDVLTGLSNRAAFNESFAAMIEEAEANGRGFALLCLDLDRFKEVNDVFGHRVGDELLRRVAQKLRGGAKEARIARVGGDEFTVMLTGEPLPQSASDIAESLRDAIAAPFEIDGFHLSVGLSVGVALYPDHGDSAELLANADAALYRAKAEGGGRVCFFDSELDNRLRERHALLQDLRHAIEYDELTLYYQPQAAAEGVVFGFEALLRWRRRGEGFISPEVFIPIAEESGLIGAIGDWVLREACREAASWPRPLSLAVNLSPAQFRRDDLSSFVHALLLETGLPANRLELEITEGVLIEDFSRVTSILRRLKALGVRIAMDDFGAGYSSLSYLQSFPFDKIKIDRSFVSSLNSNPNAAPIIRAIIGLGSALGAPVIAEGVETEEQLAFLRDEGCVEAQGFLIGKPRAIDEYAEIVGREATDPRARASA